MVILPVPAAEFLGAMAGALMGACLGMVVVHAVGVVGVLRARGPAGPAGDELAWAAADATAPVPGAPVAPAPLEPLVLGREPSPVTSRLPRVSISAAAALAADGGQAVGVTVRAASCRGRAHMEAGETLQDAYVVVAEPGSSWLVAAVADGVSSSPDGLGAAGAAVASVARRAPRWLEKGWPAGRKHWHELFEAIAGDVERATGDGERALAPAVRHGLLRGARPSTTLSIVVVVPGHGDAARIACAAVGDTGVFRLGDRPGGPRCEPILPPAAAERYGSGRVSALPDGVAQLRCEEAGWSDEVLFIASDGFANALGDGNDLERQLGELWRVPPAPLDFLRHVDFRLASHTDDRTVLAMWRGAHDQRVR